jgi:RecA-family ATPase
MLDGAHPLSFRRLMPELTEYNVPSQDPHEIAFLEYEYQRWQDDPQSWSPLINLEQLEKRPNLEIEWYCPDFIPVGAKTILSAEPKTGKTILLFHILKAVTEGGEFLGKPCPPTRVLYLTEQTEQEFKRQICEIPGLIGNPNFYVLLAEETPDTMKTWEDMIEFAEEYLEKVKAKILVIDTFGGLAKLPPGGENDSATIQNFINKLNKLFKNRYLSVVLTHHNRKRNEDPRSSGNNLSMSSARGSSAFVGGGGHLIFMNAPDNSSMRQFNFFGRYLHGMSKTLYLINDHYQESQHNLATRRY